MLKKSILAAALALTSTGVLAASASAECQAKYQALFDELKPVLLNQILFGQARAEASALKLEFVSASEINHTMTSSFALDSSGGIHVITGSAESTAFEAEMRGYTMEVTELACKYDGMAAKGLVAHEMGHLAAAYAYPETRETYFHGLSHGKLTYAGMEFFANAMAAKILRSIGQVDDYLKVVDGYCSDGSDYMCERAKALRFGKET